MHYHWTTANGFSQMLQGSNESWLPHIQDSGVLAGRLFTVGPGSYILADQNLWGNHTEIVNTVQNIDFVDGFQFIYCYGTWEDYQYWQRPLEIPFSKIEQLLGTCLEYENISCKFMPSPALSNHTNR